MPRRSSSTTLPRASGPCRQVAGTAGRNERSSCRCPAPGQSTPYAVLVAGLSPHRAYRRPVSAVLPRHRRSGHDRHRQRPRVRAGAQAGREAGRARSGEDRLLQQRQSRVQDAAHAAARTPGDAARWITRSARRCCEQPQPDAPQRAAPAAAGERAARLLAHGSRAALRAVRADRPGPLYRRPGERLPLGAGEGGTCASPWTARRCRRRSTWTATCGRRSS